MIYFDNAATGGYKPASSVSAAEYAIERLTANPGRSGHSLSEEAAMRVYETRKKVAAFFGAENAERTVFTLNCTAALNLALFGLARRGNVVTTVTEHNSVLRPLYELKKRGIITLTIVSPATSAVTAEDIKPYIKADTRMVVLNSASNVTGAPNDVSGVGNLLKNSDAYFVVDGAQGGGHLPLDITRDHIDALCLAGHKGLMSIMGAGALVFGKNADIAPLVFGGTGTETFLETMPEDYPERLEAGTLDLPAILSLGGGIDYLNENFRLIRSSLITLTEYLVERLAENPKIRLYSVPNACGIVSFSHALYASQELAGILSSAYGIAVRGGFHCAPLMHSFLGTDKEGLVRVSLSPKNTKKEINALITALSEL